MTAQHLARLEGRRRPATLVAFAIEMEVALTDAAILMVETRASPISAMRESEVSGFPS